MPRHQLRQPRWLSHRSYPTSGTGFKGSSPRRLPKEPVRELLDRRACRIVIENMIVTAIGFCRMDALSAAVPRKVHLDPQITLMASVLGRVVAKRLGN